MRRRISCFSGIHHLQLLSIFFKSQLLEIKCARPLSSKCTCTKRPNIYQSLEKTVTQTFSAQKEISHIRRENRLPSLLLGEKQQQIWTFIKDWKQQSWWTSLTPLNLESRQQLFIIEKQTKSKNETKKKKKKVKKKKEKHKKKRFTVA